MSGPIRRWGSAFQLDDLLNQMPGSADVAVRDFALLTIVGHLSATFPKELVFKGGFVLRHVHGFLRFSSDADSTRHAPPRHKFDADEVAQVIREASVSDIVRFDPQEPATDSARSLDFDEVRISGSTIHPDRVQMEISYRESVVDEPAFAYVGEPFYEAFEILVMTLPEMSAEKLRLSHNESDRPTLRIWQRYFCEEKHLMKTLLGSRNISSSLSGKEPRTASNELNSIFARSRPTTTPWFQDSSRRLRLTPKPWRLSGPGSGR